jgi:hypothetical protein
MSARVPSAPRGAQTTSDIKTLRLLCSLCIFAPWKYRTKRNIGATTLLARS